MTQKIIQQGAEALIIKEKDYILKDRIKKNYRIKEIDEKLRKQRTKKEANLLLKASQLINSPTPLKVEKMQIKMPLIKGKKLSEIFDSLKKEEQKKICLEIGKALAKLHDNDIIHGDLTTSNIILDGENKLWFIDFGLGFISSRIEDKAVDIHLIKQAFEAKHFRNWEQDTRNILEGYKHSKNFEKTITQLKKVESRGRYKGRY
jgi:TP53 regulating kinase and related kinases